MHRTPVSAAVISTLLLFVLTPVDAPAQQVEDGTITVIQPKPVLRRQRVQLTPRVGSTLNDSLYRQWSVGASLSYNISERVFIGGLFEWFDFDEAIGGPTRRYETVIDDTRAVPEVAPLEWAAGLELGYVPLYGKLVLFNKAIGYFDLYASGGALAVDSQRGVHVGGHLGAGFNLYFSRWLGLNTEFRDRMTVEEVPTRGNVFTNTVTATVGLTVLLPFNFNYRYDEQEAR